MQPSFWHPTPSDHQQNAEPVAGTVSPQVTKDLSLQYDIASNQYMDFFTRGTNTNAAASYYQPITSQSQQYPSQLGPSQLGSYEPYQLAPYQLGPYQTGTSQWPTTFQSQWENVSSPTDPTAWTKIPQYHSQTNFTTDNTASMGFGNLPMHVQSSIPQQSGYPWLETMQQDNIRNYQQATAAYHQMESSQPATPDFSYVPGSPAPMFKNMRFKRVRHNFGRQNDPMNEPPTTQLSQWANRYRSTKKAGMCGEDTMLSGWNLIGHTCCSIIELVEHGIKGVMSTFSDLDTNTQYPLQNGQVLRQHHHASSYPNVSTPRGSTSYPALSGFATKEEEDRAIADEVRRAIAQWH